MKPKVTCSRKWLSRHSTKLVLLIAAVMFVAPLWVFKGYTEDVDQVARDNAQSIHRIQAERKERISTQKAINAYVCEENNNQDGLLAGLLAFSLAASPPDRELTTQQREGKEIFASALTELNDKTDCGALNLGIIPARDKPSKQSSP